MMNSTKPIEIPNLSVEIGASVLLLPYIIGYTLLVIEHSHGISMALIEIDALPITNKWWIFPWQTVSHNQMVYLLRSY